jgi:hypothetical protein
MDVAVAGHAARCFYYLSDWLIGCERCNGQEMYSYAELSGSYGWHIGQPVREHESSPSVRRNFFGKGSVRDHGAVGRA